MTTPSALNPPDSPAPWEEIARACRRMCVLHEQGLHSEAERVRQTDLPPLLARVRASGEPAAAVDVRYAALLAAERERVANAAVLAGLLAPLLNEPPASPAPPAAGPAPSPRPPPPPRARAASIADFIDEMIAQERP